MSCKKISHPNLMPGWGCCQCKTYNGEQRLACKQCRHPYCGAKAEEVVKETLPEEDKSKLN